jgi:hypothetical protein
MKDNIGGASGGGAANFGGTNYQARVSAWLFARMLAERPVFPVGPAGHAQFVRFETSEPTDDILVGTVEGGHSFVQAKRTISLSSSPQSEFTSVVSQFVRQFLRSTSSQLVRPWSHKLEASRDRLVLVTSSDSPDTIRLNLLQLLERLKGLPRRRAALWGNYDHPVLDLTTLSSVWILASHWIGITC